MPLVTLNAQSSRWDLLVIVIMKGLEEETVANSKPIAAKNWGESRDKGKLGQCGAITLLNIFFKKKLVYIQIQILAILFYKITLCLLNNIIDSFKSNTIATNFSTTFLQIAEVVKIYWFVSWPITYINFYLLITIYHINNL